MLLTIQFLSVNLWVGFVLLCNTHTHTLNCCLSKFCGLSFVRFHIHKLFYGIPLSTCLRSQLHKRFVVQIVSFCPTHTHSTLVNIVVCLVHLCLRENLSEHTHTQSVVLFVDYLLSICVYTHTNIYFCTIYTSYYTFI